MECVNKTRTERICKYCGENFLSDNISYQINPFCCKCLPDRLKAVSPKNVKFVFDFKTGYGKFV